MNAVLLPTPVDFATATQQARPGACMFNPPVLDALSQAMVEGRRTTFWKLGDTLLELRVLGVAGQPLVPVISPAMRSAAGQASSSNPHVSPP